MNITEKYLETIQEEPLNELEPITTTVAIGGTFVIISNIISFFVMASQIKRNIPISLELSDRVNELMGTKDEWVVHIYKADTPNAFSLGVGKHLFVTSQLLKILDKDEIDAVLLHEVWHSKSKDTLKRMAIEYPFFYLIIAVAGTLVTGGVPLYLAGLACFIVAHMSKIVYALTVGRRQEYNADSFAAKKGYGPQLINALSKIESWNKAKTNLTKCGAVCKIVSSIDEAIDEHPSDKKRVERILRMSDQIAKQFSFKGIKNIVVRNWK